MSAGRRNCYVTVQQQGAQSQGDDGELADNWETYKQLWMELQAVGGRESSRARQVLAEADTVGRYDWLDAPGITARMRLVYGSRVFDILHAGDPDGRGRDGVVQLRERNP